MLLNLAKRVWPEEETHYIDGHYEREFNRFYRSLRELRTS